MEKSTVIAGAAVVGGLSLIYWLTRKKDQAAQLGADYESPSPGEAPPSDTTFFDQDLAGESDSMCGLPGSYRPTPIAERQKFFHRQYNHWCYVPDPDSPFKDMERSAHENGQCERRLNSFSPSHWTEAQVEAAGKQLVC